MKRLVETIREPQPEFISPFQQTLRKATICSPFVLLQFETLTFTGRADELAAIRMLLLTVPQPTRPHVAIIAGGGGVGKSALACEFAVRHRNDFPDGIIGLRVSGKDVETIAHEFAECSGYRIQPDDSRNATTLMQSLFRHRRCLLIFDNTTSTSIRGLIPGGTCATIITTRDRELPVLLGVVP